MVISEISIKNFKSYGNAPQTLKLNTEKGELILLLGGNGMGKSSVIGSFDFVLYGKCKGSKKKWATLSTLPNRINGTDMLNTIKFKSNGVDVEVKRGLVPSKLELWENGVLNEKAGKTNIESKIEDYVGMDIETFKSFISMSIDSFKNFISLTSEEKQLLLDKLFSLEVINILKDILKELVKTNKNRITNLDTEVNALEDSINSIKKSIERALEKEKENIDLEISQLTNEMNSNKELYLSLKDKVQKIKEKEDILKTELEQERKQFITTQNDIKNVDKEINLYNSGKCPTCSTDFNNDHFIELKDSLIQKKTTLDSVLKEIQLNIEKIREKETKLKSIANNTTNSFNDVNYLLKNYKTKIDELTRKKNITKSDNVNISEFEDSIKEISSKKEKSINIKSELKEKELYYKELARIMGEDGVKKSIISGIIKPINHFISENISSMGLPFEVKLDETFTAQIKSLGNIIEHDSLSTGETKLINISILISYLKLIRTKKHINILFLDEVFSSIDIENISKILTLLKQFSQEYKINIFVVHHAIMNEEIFDRIISIEKNIFSSIVELENFN
jgi:DNA repair exonuclease SbcCD ATPase subunit